VIGVPCFSVRAQGVHWEFRLQFFAPRRSLQFAQSFFACRQRFDFQFLSWIGAWDLIQFAQPLVDAVLFEFLATFHKCQQISLKHHLRRRPGSHRGHTLLIPLDENLSKLLPPASQNLLPYVFEPRIPLQNLPCPKHCQSGPLPAFVRHGKQRLQAVTQAVRGAS